ncbi:MAG: acetyl-CoA carboxylase biotin carboxyl carrier protein [Proteobacteria bacterium]|nr:acetyl-CoA carboxylase biotin carboxyl carrier protein [Pseudomonadota bacterium]
MDVKKLKQVIKLLKDNGLEEIEVEEKDSRIRVKSAIAGTAVALAPAQVPLEVPVADAEPSATEKKAESKYKVINSPMVGTFYRSPSPEADLYIEEGQVVKKGQTLCIVEAMKLMNEIEAEFKGKIVSILVENGQPVEYGEPLFEIDPT